MRLKAKYFKDDCHFHHDLSPPGHCDECKLA